MWSMWSKLLLTLRLLQPDKALIRYPFSTHCQIELWTQIGFLGSVGDCAEHFDIYIFSQA